jgi:ATP/maltotriose-dependent transcriptional regulator MalT
LNGQDLMTHGPFELPLAEAELALAKHDTPRAVAVIDELLARLRQIGMRSFLADALYLKGRALHAQGKIAEAHVVLTEARVETEALGSRRMLWQILAALSQIEAERGHPAEARQLQQQARDTLAYIVEHISPPDLRASFLNQPAVHAIFAFEPLSP